MPTRTAIYLFGHDAEEGPTKVGFSHDPQRRLRQLQTGHPHKLTIFALYWFEHRQSAEDVETQVLHLWARKRLHGEWLDISPRTAFNTIGLALGKAGANEHIIESLEPLLIEATDDEVLGLVPPRHGATATAEQIERLLEGQP